MLINILIKCGGAGKEWMDREEEATFVLGMVTFGLFNQF